MSRLRSGLRSLVWLFPAGRGKNRLLRSLGHPVHPSAIASSCLVLNVSVVSMAPGSRIGRFNVFKNLRQVIVGDDSTIGRFNTITANPVFVRLYPDGAELRLGSHAYITSRHRLDCSGSVRVDDFASVAGHSTTILTHSIDLRMDAQAAYPVRVGTRSFVGARCVLLGGATLPESSVLAAGSVLTRARADRAPGLWAGVPAKHHGPIDGAWFTREATGTSRVFVPATGEIVEDALSRSGSTRRSSSRVVPESAESHSSLRDTAS